MTEDPQHWRQQARCRNEDPERMQPEVATEAEVEEAKAVCAGCPVALQCRDLARSQLYAYGVHAGQWYGEDPRRPLQVTCAHCEGPMDVSESRRSSGLYCKASCRVAAHRAGKRRAGVVGA